MTFLLRISILLLIVFNLVEAKEFVIDTTKANTAIFFGKITLGTLSGETSRIAGYVRWNNDDTTRGEVLVRVDLGSLDTGIGLRNKHMREKYLETDKFPFAEFRGRINDWKSSSNGLDKVRVKGTMKIHGIEKPFEQVVTVVKRENGLRVSTLFKLNILDFNIQQPRYLVVSMNPEVTVRAVFYLKEK